MTTGEIDKVARDIIGSYGYANNFGHNLGHGVGIMVHEYPALAPESNEVLKRRNDCNYRAWYICSKSWRRKNRR